MEKSFFLPFFLLFCLFVRDIVSRSPNRNTDDPNNIDDDRIVGGYDITIQDAPYQVLLYLQKGDNQQLCGGSIINEKYILTAAHCVEGSSIVYVFTGTTLTDSGGYEYITTQYTAHPNYDAVNKDYDVALIKIEDGMELNGTNTTAVELPDENSRIAPGTNLRVTGWGLTKENGSESNNLKAVQVTTISHDECLKIHEMLTPRQLCAGVPEGGKDSCQGDSGGPAVATDSRLQVGIVSFGLGCGQKGIPGIYIEVTGEVRRWIKTNSGV